MIQYDFETAGSVAAWQPVGSQIPPGVLTGLVQSTAAAHNGTGSLAMQFAGTYDPADSGTPANPFYGIYMDYRLGVVPPPNTTVTLWVMATAPGASVGTYVQISPSWDWVGLTNTGVLPAGTWQQVTLTTPANQIWYFGLQTFTSLTYQGTIYLDQISW